MNLIETTQVEHSGSVKAVLEFLEQQLEMGEVEPLPDSLGGLAKAFAVDMAGVGVLLEDAPPAGSVQYVAVAAGDCFWGNAIPEVLPWQEDANLLQRATEAKGPLEMPSADGCHWLVCVVRLASVSWLIWLVSRQPRAWSNGDKSCLTLAGDSILRKYLEGPEGSQWLTRKRRLQLQERINCMAAVTRRLTHDYCNILTSISGFAELALMSMPTDSTSRRFVSEAFESARHGAKWVQKLQLFSLNRPQKFVPVKLSSVCADEQAKPDWTRGIALKIDLPAQLPSVAMEREALRLVLVAILDNAREAIDGAGIVSVAARPMQLSADACLELLGDPRPGPYVEVKITDSGAGLTAEERGRLFRDPFLSKKGRRRGLGLAGVFGIMQSYQGGFRLDPASDHSGTTVTLFLPQAEPTASATPSNLNRR